MSHARGQPVAALGDTRKTKHDPYTKQFCCAAAFSLHGMNVWNVTNLLLSPHRNTVVGINFARAQHAVTRTPAPPFQC